ncbi:MAG TPA: glycosyltransferase family 4 protein [Gemmatimonadaceae bacterium]|nr:glycosyltransferase family 4 protein [Gemmatimonadaceae bacterium]
MRILLVNWQDRENPEAGGAEIHLHELFGRLAASGHDITLLCSGWKGCMRRVELDDIQIHRVGTRYTFQFLARRYYRQHLAAADHDVLIEDINKVPLFTPLWGAKQVVTLVPHLFGTTAFREVSPPLAAMVWLSELPITPIYRRSAFHAISESTADDLAARGIPRNQIRVIYPGVDTVYFTPSPDERAPNPVFAYVGRLKRYKGVDIVMRAFAELRHPTATLEIAGTGDYRPTLEALAASLDLGQRVRFLGFISEEEKRALLRRAWALAFASPKEGWGITNLEAAASGTPVVASNSPGLRESVRDGETGFLVRHADVSAMADAFRRLAESPELVGRLAVGARAFAERFTWDDAARQTEDHLSEVVHAPLSSSPDRSPVAS